MRRSMRTLGVKIAAVWLMAVTAMVASVAEPEMLCELQRDRVYLGESVQYQITLNNCEKPSQPKLVGFDDFDVSGGGLSLSTGGIQITINGRKSMITERGAVYGYVLTPRRAGRLAVPAPTVEVDGRTLRGNELSLVVLEPDSQDVVRMEITADPPAVYPTQRLTIRLSVLIRALPEELAGRSPLSVQSTPPALQIPWAQDESLAEGLAPVEDARSWLGRLRDLAGEGFSINNLVDASVFSIFERRALAFQPQPRRVTRKDAKGQEQDFWLYAFDRSFVPSRPGRYTFGPATLKGKFATGVSSERRLTGEDIYAVARPINVEVKQVPEVGRPASYLGAVGNFTWSAELRPTECKVGDPLTLVLSLAGRGSLGMATAPDLSLLPEVTKHFKTYAGTAEVKGDTCQFTYTLRPLSEEVKEFPPIPGAYFDVQSDRYVTLATEPIPLRVEKADTLAAAQMVGPSGAARSPEQLQVRREGLFANLIEPSEFRDESVHAERWLAGAAELAGCYVLLATAMWFVRRRTADPAMVRRRGAAPRARRRIGRGVAEEIRGALVGLVADVVDAPEAGMTTADACRRLRGVGVEEPIVERLAQLLEECDAARYAQAAADTSPTADEAAEILDAVVRSLKKGRIL
jgi:hypothetical protein